MSPPRHRMFVIADKWFAAPEEALEFWNSSSLSEEAIGADGQWPESGAFYGTHRKGKEECVPCLIAPIWSTESAVLSRSLVIVSSYHHKNTEKVAEVFARVLDAQIKTPQQIDPQELQDYSLIGFGSGIYGGKNHELLLDLADRLPQIAKGRAFIFSTSATTKRSQPKMHLPLVEKLQSKGYVIVDEFNCKGFNTNNFIKLFGGMNKGRPNTDDLRQAEEFAQNLKQKLQEE